MKTLILLCLVFLSSCSSFNESAIREKAQKRVLESVVQLQMHKDGIFQKCTGFFIKPNKLLTNNHCTPTDINLSFIARKEIALFEAIISVNVDLDYVVLKTVKDNSLNQSYIPKESMNESEHYLIPRILKDKLSFIKCSKIIDENSLLNKLSCESPIVKSMSGSPILNDKYEFTGVLVGFLQKDSKIAVYTIL